MSDLTLSANTGYHDFGALATLKGEAAREPQKVARKAAEQFEAYFIQNMLKTMRESIEKSDLVDHGSADMYQDLMDKEVSMQMVRRGGIGLADMLEKQMLQRQALSTQDALQARAAGTPQGLPLNPERSPLPLQVERKATNLPKANDAGLPLKHSGDES